jgi:XTP/dITP diphosphohydrolase
MIEALVIATHNAGKLREIKALLAPFDIAVSSAAEHGAPEPEETGKTFAENAEIKARATCEATGMAALADDSGLSVDALSGAPGIYSARWAVVAGSAEKDFAAAMARIEHELDDKPRGAAFICALCLCLPDGTVHHFQGEVRGMLTFPARGDAGFGYDPIFIPEGETRTFAQMSAEEKQVISHRARAFSLCVQFLQANKK